MSNPVSPRLASIGASRCNDVVRQGPRAHLLRCSGLDVVDLDTGGPPVILGTLPFPEFANGGGLTLAVGESHAYVGGTFGVRVIDVSDPATPRVASNLSTARVHEVARVGSHLWVTQYLDSELLIIDVSDPTAPSVKAALPTPSRPVGLAAEGSYAYVTSLGDFHVIDGSDPARPRIVGTAETEFRSLGPVAVEGSYAHVLSNTSRLVVFDVTDPERPRVRGAVSLPYRALDVAVAGSHAYAGGEFGIAVVDVSRPEKPELVGEIPARSDDAVSVAAGSVMAVSRGGLEVFPAQCPRRVTRITTSVPGATVGVELPRLSAFPLPFRGGELQVRFAGAPAAGPVTLTLHDTAGRRVRTITRSAGPSVGGVVSWDGRDARGARLAAGVYFLRMETPAGTTSLKVPVLR